MCAQSNERPFAWTLGRLSSQPRETPKCIHLVSLHGASREPVSAVNRGETYAERLACVPTSLIYLPLQGTLNPKTPAMESQQLFAGLSDAERYAPMFTVENRDSSFQPQPRNGNPDGKIGVTLAFIWSLDPSHPSKVSHCGLVDDFLDLSTSPPPLLFLAPIPPPDHNAYSVLPDRPFPVLLHRELTVLCKSLPMLCNRRSRKVTSLARRSASPGEEMVLHRRVICVMRSPICPSSLLSAGIV